MGTFSLHAKLYSTILARMKQWTVTTVGKLFCHSVPDGYYRDLSHLTLMVKMLNRSLSVYAMPKLYNIVACQAHPVLRFNLIYTRFILRELHSEYIHSTI